MVGIVLVSHSEKVAEGVKELSLQMAGDAKIAAAGGTEDGRLGSDVNKISAAIKDVYSEDGVIVLFDLGSAYMNAEMAVELMESGGDKVQIVDCAFVEGAITAAVESSLEKNIEDIKMSIEKLKLDKMP
ncbi:PTS-dependent dihydroxyacetone kinase phosphotransferase subunit DhaM [Clostridium sp. cel8]|jgi:phosphoenolpyruvate---glycerone phosphotransferase subunit DhaM|uniref:dihydroxyacetone kinase phosphoryl donor subunit DhaM n=1 Tax=Clostridium sp. cel8 TaxID=2663123 RepID=UPI0015F73FEE|nr:dihydroxyacetone kinase phosphoryl donor subunit DhaM [Clostridium sp. cel8]MBA5850232.1 PTS-dependent dihydroxyacetone kinase phosphotransferase subunit DhaM [Clostridium sp. cel8]